MVMKVVKTYKRTKMIYYKFKGILLMFVSLQTFGLIFFLTLKMLLLLHYPLSPS